MRTNVPMFALVTIFSIIASPLWASQPSDFSDVQISLVHMSHQNHATRQKAVSRLAWEVRKRTSIAMSLDVSTIDLANPLLFEHPISIMSVETPLEVSIDDARRLRQYLMQGGTLWIDLADAEPGGPVDRSVRALLQAAFPQSSLTQIGPEHVLYKSFYLLHLHGGRVLAKPYVEGITIDRRLAVVYSSNDILGAFEPDAFGGFAFDTGLGGDAIRETSLRWGINFIMYALCDDYKSDQVHLPFILKRRH